MGGGKFEKVLDLMNLEDFRSGFLSFSTQPLSRGGQKVVYSAFHPVYGDVVVKRIINPDERIDREVSIVRSNEFMHVPHIFDVLSVDWGGQPALVIVEEMVRGLSLRDVIERGERYDLSQVIDFLEQGLRFVETISARGIVHRDIKPENIIRDTESKYHYLDFGIARDLGADSLTQTGQGPNTPGYAAPEVFLGDKAQIDQKSDLFSFGVVAYELASGVNPFRKAGESALAIYMNTLTQSPTDLRIKGDRYFALRSLITSLMSRDRYKRPNDAKEAIEWLDGVKADLGIGER